MTKPPDTSQGAPASVGTWIRYVSLGLEIRFMLTVISDLKDLRNDPINTNINEVLNEGGQKSNYLTTTVDTRALMGQSPGSEALHQCR